MNAVYGIQTERDGDLGHQYLTYRTEDGSRHQITEDVINRAVAYIESQPDVDEIKRSLVTDPLTGQIETASHAYGSEAEMSVRDVVLLALSNGVRVPYGDNRKQIVSWTSSNPNA